VAALCLNLSLSAQDISLNISNITVKEAMEQLKKTSGYSFVFSSVDVNTKKRVSISVENATIETVVNLILKGQDRLSYEIRDKKIIVKKELPLTASTPGKEKITGNVVDINGEPVIGATIREEGTSNGTVTDIDGNFTLDAVANSVLEISYIGYETQKIQTQSGKMLAVTMKEDTRILDEVVVIGYGTTTRREFTGSVTSLRLEDSPAALASNTNALEFLKGNISGLDIGATNTAGGQPSMLIRGQTSISGENNPLIIVDGVIFMGAINDINPNDIASVDVLKDATSAAAYGSRSANGVIIITTKRGKLGKPLINLNVTGSMQNWHRQPALMKGEQYLNMICDKSGFKDYGFLTPQERMNYEAGRETDWLDEATRTGWMQDHQIAVSGAGEKMNYYLSTSYTDNQGIVAGDDFSRITLLGKINTDITDWLQIGVDISYAHSDYSGVGADINKAILLAPYDIVYRDAAHTLPEKYPTGHNEFENPLWGVDSDNLDDKDVRRNFRINAYATVKLPWVKGLSYRLNYAGYFDAIQNGRFYHESYYVPLGPYDDDSRYSEATRQAYLGTANGYFQNETADNLVIDNILNYKNTFKKHTVDLTAVATRDSWIDRKDRMDGRDFLSNGNTLLGMDGLHYATTQKNSTNIIQRRNAGYFTRASYSFDNAYYLTASYRRDGASVFGADNKWGNFFAFGGAWRISHEKFMGKADFLNDMKLKLSWGRNGNQGLSPYGTLSQVAVGSTGGLVYPFGNAGLPSFGVKQTTLGNSRLAWETTDSWNTGFESTWLNNRLFVDLDVYFTRTYDQIFNRTIPVMSGFNVMSSSMGEVANRGVELNVRSVNIQKKDWRWDTSFTFWLNRNKLIHLYGEDMNNDGKEDDDLGNSLFIGHSIHAIYGYGQDGIVQKDDAKYIEANGVQPGAPKYADRDGDGVITVNDRTIVGNRDPRFKMSLNNTISWKNLELYVMLTGTFGGNGYYQEVNNPAFLAGGGGGGQYSNNMYIPYWTEDRPSDKYPAATFQGDDRFLGVQSRTFVRLQDVTLSYSFDMPCIKNTGIHTLRLFFTGRNLATVTGWKGGDPEMGNVLLSGTYPIATTLSLGANISF
jgi:TonB-linked SusC/RagA family outer membrane protein